MCFVVQFGWYGLLESVFWGAVVRYILSGYSTLIAGALYTRAKSNITKKCTKPLENVSSDGSVHARDGSVHASDGSVHASYGSVHASDGTVHAEKSCDKKDLMLLVVLK